MICDICKRKIMQIMKHRIPFYKIDTFWIIQERIQEILFDAQDKRTAISKYFREDQVKILKNMLDEIEILIGKIVPYIEE